jgi:mitochondrial import inner membrane translocase subunit TIM10
MSFFGMGRPQLSSAEQIAAVEAEMKMMSDMHNR